MRTQSQAHNNAFHLIFALYITILITIILALTQTFQYKSLKILQNQPINTQQQIEQILQT